MTKQPKSGALPPARRMALRALTMTLGQNRDVQSALDRVLADAEGTDADRTLCTELTYGYLRYKGRLDFLLLTRLDAKKKLPARVTRTLGLALYEMLFLSRIPSYATVNWAVDAVRKDGGPGLAKLANGVLRALSELPTEGDDPDLYREDNPPLELFLSRYYSCPKWIVTLWLNSFGRERTELLLQGSLRRPPVSLRVNMARLEGSKLLAELTQATDCLEANGPGLALSRAPKNITELEQSGLVSRQSLAAQNALAELHPETWPAPILDGCSGRGGKSLFLAEQGYGPIMASDVNMFRLRGLLEEQQRLNIHFPVFRASASAPFPLQTMPITMLLDVACSGLGVLSRRPDSKWKRTKRDLKDLERIQREILDNSWAQLPEGGKIVYLTCTVNTRENEEQVGAFLKRAPEARLEREYRTVFDSGLGEFFYGAVISKG